MSVLDGASGLAKVGPGYDVLTRSLAVPVTARWPWLSIWAATHPSWRPLSVLVGTCAAPDGVALLARRRRGPLLEVVLLGHGQSDYSRLPAVSPVGSAMLADAVHGAVVGLPRPRRVRLDQLPAADPVLTRLASTLPGGELLDGEAAPVIALVPGSAPQVGREARTMARRGENRLRSDGRTAAVQVVTEPDAVARLLPELERVHRGRDHDVRGVSDLDNPEDRAFWYAIGRHLAEQGQLEVTTLRVDGGLAAYLLALVDGTAYRVWDPRIHGQFSRYNPGHVLRAQVLDRVATSGQFTEFDWMKGVERYKLGTTSQVVPTHRMLAWSPVPLRRTENWMRNRVQQVRRLRAGVAQATGTGRTTGTPRRPGGSDTAKNPTGGEL